jgi:hypothetical protein
MLIKFRPAVRAVVLACGVSSARAAELKVLCAGAAPQGFSDPQGAALLKAKGMQPVS